MHRSKITEIIITSHPYQQTDTDYAQSVNYCGFDSHLSPELFLLDQSQDELDMYTSVIGLNMHKVS